VRFLPRALSVVLIAGLILLGLPGSAWAAVASRTATTPVPAGATSNRVPSKVAAKQQVGAETRAPERPRTQQPAARGFSEEQRKRYAEQDKKDKKSDNYKGGVTLIIGGGVLVVALLIVLIIVLVD
jgi:hypothetical protein